MVEPGFSCTPIWDGFAVLREPWGSDWSGDSDTVVTGPADVQTQSWVMAPSVAVCSAHPGRTRTVMGYGRCGEWGAHGQVPVLCCAVLCLAVPCRAMLCCRSPLC